MKWSSHCIFLPAVLLAGAFFICESAAVARTQQDSVQTIEVTAKNYDFTPAEIHIRAGTTVRLRVLATDRDHGVQFDLYPDGAKKKGEPGLRFNTSEAKFKTPKGQPTEIEFVALQPGTYTFKCSVVCGMGHRRMKGKLIVE
jgi:cytochrome c oxidase subunit 2